ncbi:phosphotransferase [Risungbinella massiliensis]|uniref:phosphotransferase n=1 Tax=Risungbinella massiliensis TaxID=1329796 RepID=UPI0005CC2FEE|nr:phosphotransferase [Risungbinella massiliensis]
MLKIHVDVKLPASRVKELVEYHYTLIVKSISKVRAAYRVETDQGVFAFKNAYKLQDIDFIEKMIQTLHRQGFHRIPKIIFCKDHRRLISYAKELYYLEEWLPNVTEVNRNKMNWLTPAGETLSEYHQILAKIPLDIIPKQRDSTGKWEAKLQKSLRRLQKICKRTFRTDWEQTLYSFFHDRLLYAQNLLESSGPSPFSPTLCHGSLHHENIMIDPSNKVWLIDYERMTWEDPTKDLAQLMEYHFPSHDWPKAPIEEFLSSYCGTSVGLDDIPYLKARLAASSKLLRNFRAFYQGEIEYDMQTINWLKKERAKEHLWSR